MLIRVLLPIAVLSCGRYSNSNNYCDVYQCTQINVLSTVIGVYSTLQVYSH